LRVAAADTARLVSGGAEREQDVTVGADDILLARTGLVRRLVQLGAWDTTKAKPGVNPRAMQFLALWMACPLCGL
jgi:hypothetical protein